MSDSKDGGRGNVEKEETDYNNGVCSEGGGNGTDELYFCVYFYIDIWIN